MIKNYYGRKVTPKHYAAGIVRSNLDGTHYWQENYDLRDMTKKEIAKIDEQIAKISARFEKALDKILMRGKNE